MTSRARHRVNYQATQRGGLADWLAKLTCKFVGHDPEQRFTGATICHRCRIGLGRWRS